MTSPKARKPWTAFEDRVLFDGGQTLGDIAERTGRGVAAVKNRRSVLTDAGHKLPPIIRSDGREAPPVTPHDAPMGSPRPCARCRNTFQPTVRRRLLCRPCFDGADLPPQMAA